MRSVEFVEGIFHAHDPLEVAQYDDKEYDSIARSFVAKFDSCYDVTNDQIELWWNGCFRDEHPSLSMELVLSLLRLF
jgi:hypothetical protein